MAKPKVTPPRPKGPYTEADPTEAEDRAGAGLPDEAARKVTTVGAKCLSDSAQPQAAATPSSEANAPRADAQPPATADLAPTTASSTRSPAAA